MRGFVFADSAGKGFKRPIIMVQWQKGIAKNIILEEHEKLTKNAHFILKNKDLKIIEF